MEGAREWRANNRQKHRDYQRQWRLDNPEYYKEYSKKYNRAKILARHGLTAETFDAMLASQDGVCAICSTDTPGGMHGQWQIDHCHRTGVVRGLLCFRCNVVLSEYLEKHWLAFETYLNERGT